MAHTLNVLIVDDSEDDALLTLRELRQGGYDPSWKRVDSKEAMAAALEDEPWDIVLSDHQMPRFDSLGALEILNSSGRDIPFIIISGMIGEDTAVLAMKSGAADYLRKDNLKRLVPAIERELADAAGRREKRRLEDELRKRERIYRLITDNMSDTVWLMDMNLMNIYLSPSVERMRGFTNEELNALPLEKNVTQSSWELLSSVMADKLAPEQLNDPEQHVSAVLELEFYRKDGTTFWGECRFELIRDGEGRPEAILGVARDVTARRKAEERLIKSEARYRAIAEDAQLLICRILPDGTLTFVNGAYCTYFGKSIDELIGSNFKPLVFEEDVKAIESALSSATPAAPSVRLETRVIAPDGSVRWIWWTNHAIYREERIVEYQSIGEDVTERRQMEDDLKRQLDELRRWQDIMIDREGRVIELKKEVNNLLLELGRPEKYDN